MSTACNQLLESATAGRADAVSRRNNLHSIHTCAHRVCMVACLLIDSLLLLPRRCCSCRPASLKRARPLSKWLYGSCRRRQVRLTRLINTTAVVSQHLACRNDAAAATLSRTHLWRHGVCTHTLIASPRRLGCVVVAAQRDVLC